MERNWGAGSSELKCEVSTEVVDAGFGLNHSELMIASGDLIVFQKLPHDNFPNVVVANVITKETWRVTMEPNFTWEEVDINDSLLAIWSSSENVDTADSYTTTLKVWSVKSKEKLLEEVIPKFHHLVFDLDKSSSLPMIVLILEEKVEVLSFEDTSLSRYELAFDVDVGYRWNFSNLLSSYITHSFENEQDEFISIFVWKIDDKNRQIENHKSLPIFDSQPDDDTEENGVKVLILNAVYVSSCFVVSCFKERTWFITILNDDGDFIKEVETDLDDRYDSYTHVDFFIYGKRLFVAFNTRASLSLFKFDLEELRNVLYRKLEALIQDSTLFHAFITNKTSIASVTDQGDVLVMKKMNFWPNN